MIWGIYEFLKKCLGSDKLQNSPFQLYGCKNTTARGRKKGLKMLSVIMYTDTQSRMSKNNFDLKGK